MPSSLHECVYLLLTGTQEVKKTDTLALARLAHTEENQILTHSPLRTRSAEQSPQCSKRFDRVLSVVVVPRNAVAVQECEQFILVLLQTLLTCYCLLTPVPT